MVQMRELKAFPSPLLLYSLQAPLCSVSTNPKWLDDCVGDVEGSIHGMSFRSLCIQSSVYIMCFPVMRKTCLAVIQYNILIYAKTHFHIVHMRPHYNNLNYCHCVGSSMKLLVSH